MLSTQLWFWSPEFSLHWTLCSTTHTMNSLQWVRIAVCTEHDVHASLSHKYRYRPWTEQEEFQVWWGRHLYVDCTILKQGWNLEEPLPLFFFA
jgi:hypothetical protein